MPNVYCRTSCRVHADEFNGPCDASVKAAVRSRGGGGCAYDDITDVSAAGRILSNRSISSMEEINEHRQMSNTTQLYTASDGPVAVDGPLNKKEKEWTRACVMSLTGFILSFAIKFNQRHGR